MKFKLGTKILTAVLAVIISMTAGIAFFGHYFIRQSISERILRNAESSNDVYDALTAEAERRVRQGNNLISISPKVKAAVGTNVQTVLQTMGELIDSTELNLGIYFTRPGQIQSPDGLSIEPGLAAVVFTQDFVAGTLRSAMHVNPQALAKEAQPDDLFGFDEEVEKSTGTSIDELRLSLGRALERWELKALDNSVLADPLLAYLETQNQEYSRIQEAYLRTRDGKLIGRLKTSKTLISVFQKRLYLVSFRALYTLDTVANSVSYLGMIVGGVELDDRTARRIHLATGLHVAFLEVSSDRRAEIRATSFPEGPDGESGRIRANEYADMLGRGLIHAVSRPMTHGVEGHEYVIQAVHMRTASQRRDNRTGNSDDSLGALPRGITVLEGDLTGGVRHALSNLTPTLLAVSVLAALLAIIVLSYGMKVWVTDPVNELTSGMIRIQDGNLQVEIPARTQDEMGALAQAYNRMLADLQRKEQYMRMVSKSAVQEIETKGAADLTDESSRRVVTVLFSDIRDFTTLSEKIDPGKLVKLLNRYFDAMVEIIYRHGGVLDKFIGDAIMAIFEEEDHPRRAVFAAMEMQAECQRLDREEGLGLKIGVGLNTGEVVAGFVGAKEFMNHTYLGDAVNLAARLESESKYGKFSKVIISQSTYDALPGILDTATLEKTTVKGKTQEVRMHEIIRILDVSEIERNLYSEDPEKRRKFTYAAGHLGNLEMVPRLVELTRDEHADTALAAISSLNKIIGVIDHKNGTYADHFLKQLGDETRPPLRAALVTLLGSIGDHSMVAKLETYLADPDDRVRANLVEALGRLGSRSIQVILRPLLDDSNNRVKANAAICLFESHPEEVSSRLIHQLQDPDWTRRASAAFAIHIMVSRYPQGLLDPARAVGLDHVEFRRHSCFRKLNGALTVACASEQDTRVISHISNALSVMIGADMAQNIVAAALSHHRDPEKARSPKA